MIVVAYSGLSQTEWRLCVSTTEIIQFTTEELNPIYVDSYTVVRALMNRFPNDVDPRNVTKVFFYGTGCTAQQHQQRIVFCLESFFEEAEVNVDTDLLGAAKGVFDRKSGLIAILGASTSTCAYDGLSVIETSTPLNFHIGNEGGGISIGSEIAQSYYYKYMPDDLLGLFQKETGMTQEELYSRLNSFETPHTFLTNLVTFGSAHKEHSFIKHLVQESFRKFLELHLLPLSIKTGMKNIGIVGPIGFLFEEIVQNELDLHHLQTDKMLYSPIEVLTRYRCSYL